MPTDQKVTGLSPVGVTRRERQMLFPLLFTAACNLQAVFSHLVFCGFHGEIGDLFKPMRKPKNPDEHGHRDDRKMQRRVKPALFHLRIFPFHPSETGQSDKVF